MAGNADLRVGVLGSTGYTGAELLRLLACHPRVLIAYIGGRSELGRKVSELHPQLHGINVAVEPIDAARMASRVDVVFCALPHGASMGIVPRLRAHGLIVIDLSADFRLRSQSTYEQWYGSHAAPELLNEAVYGLPELHRNAIAESDLIAVPGCYPTATVLALTPLLVEKLVDAHRLVVDAKSGVSGAGRRPANAGYFCETSEGLRAYKVGAQHRHIPEIEQEINRHCDQTVRITFTPHLVPMNRGLLATVYAPASPAISVDAAACRGAASRLYQDSPFVSVLAESANPDTLWVRGANRAQVAYAVDGRTDTVIAQCAIDNLVKGAAGQAIQCMNVRFGYKEDAGLEGSAVFP